MSFEHLRLWCQALEELIAGKGRIETGIRQELRNLFRLKPDLMF